MKINNLNKRLTVIKPKIRLTRFFSSVMIYIFVEPKIWLTENFGLPNLKCLNRNQNRNPKIFLIRLIEPFFRKVKPVNRFFSSVFQFFNLVFGFGFCAHSYLRECFHNLVTTVWGGGEGN